MTDVLFLYPNLEYVAELRVEIAGICTNLDGSKREMEGTCLALKKKKKKRSFWGSGSWHASKHSNFSEDKRSRFCMPGAKCAAIGAYVVEGGLGRVGVLFPLPFVDDELPLKVGQELEVLLLLSHTHHLNNKTGRDCHCDADGCSVVNIFFLFWKNKIPETRLNSLLVLAVFQGKDSQTSSAGRR